MNVRIVGSASGSHEAIDLYSDEDESRDLLLWKRNGYIPAATEIASTSELGDATIRGILDLVEQQEKRAFRVGKEAMREEFRKLLKVERAL